MKFSFLRNILFLISTIELPSLACISRVKSTVKAPVQTTIIQAKPETREKYNFDYNSEFLESPEGVTFVWLGKTRPELGKRSESSWSVNETLSGLRVKRGVQQSVYYYEVNSDPGHVRMPWYYPDHPEEHEDLGDQEKPTDKEKATKASLFFVAAIALKILLKLAKFFLATIPALLIVPTLLLLYTSFLAGIFFGRIFQARNTAITAPGTPGTGTGTTTTTTVRPPGGTGSANLWTEPGQAGAGAALSGPIGQCVDFPPVFDKMLQSLDTMNNCVIICDTAGCTGVCYRFENAGVINDLGSFNMMASSLMFC